MFNVGFKFDLVVFRCWLTNSFDIACILGNAVKILISTLLLLSSVGMASAADDVKNNPTATFVFREPFTLSLHIDREHFYEEKFGKIPFVHDSNVYLFSGDEFGLSLNILDNAISAVKYQPELKKADVTLKFTQEVQPDGSAMMLLHIQNNTKHVINIDALMTVPGRRGIAKTSILPVRPGLSSFESWPHPIVQLVLRNIRVAK